MGALAAVVVCVDLPVLKYPLNFWNEPWQALFHLTMAIGMYLALRPFVGGAAAFVAAMTFGLYSGPRHIWASGISTAGNMVSYLAAILVCVGWAFGIAKLDFFLKSQERILRVLFWIGTTSLIMGMGLMSVQANRVWRDADTLWQYRVNHYPTPVSLNAWGNLLYEKRNQPMEALKIFELSLKADPHNQNAFLALGLIYQDLAKPREAIYIYNRMLKAYPDDERVRLRIMNGYSRALANHPDQVIYQEKREELLAEYEQLTKRKKYTANDYYNLGFLYEQVGGFEEAMRFYRKALDLSPSHEKALYNLANRYQTAGDIKTALILYARLIKINPKFTFAYLNMAVITNALGDASKARALYQKVIRIDPSNAQAYFHLGYLHESDRELREAIANYEKAVEHDPRHAEAYYNMGNAYATLEQYPEAIASYLKTVGINPDHQSAYVNLSILSFKAKDFQGAIRYLEEARFLGYNPPEEYLKTLDPYRGKR